MVLLFYPYLDYPGFDINKTSYHGPKSITGKMFNTLGWVKDAKFTPKNVIFCFWSTGDGLWINKSDDEKDLIPKIVHRPPELSDRDRELWIAQTLYDQGGYYLPVGVDRWDHPISSEPIFRYLDEEHFGTRLDATWIGTPPKHPIFRAYHQLIIDTPGYINASVLLTKCVNSYNQGFIYPSCLDRVHYAGNPFNTWINKIFVLNLDSRPERYHSIVTELTKFGIHNYERFSAIVGTPGERRIGVDGCFKSHLAMIQLAKNRGYEKVMILEDDFIIRSRAIEFLTLAIQEIPADWKMLYLATCGINRQLGDFISPHLQKIKFAYSGLGYIVHHDVYDVILNTGKTFSSEIDTMYAQCIQPVYSCYRIDPEIITLGMSQSDIRNCSPESERQHYKPLS